MYRAIEVSSHEDLTQFSRLLWQRRISHRIHQLDDIQLVAVPEQHQVNEVANLYRQWRQGDVLPTQTDSANFATWISPGAWVVSGLRAFMRAPLTLVLIIACTVLLLVAPLDGMNALVRDMLYPDFGYGTNRIVLSRVLDRFTLVQFLQMISPILLHGGLIHLVFNMLWLWEFGKRIEAVQASWAMGLLVLVLALVSNTVQYLYGGSNLFGGMSGVVYGLFAYIWMWQLLCPRKKLGLPGALVFFMLLSLLLVTALGLDFIADAAHLGGLFCGLFYGAITALYGRFTLPGKNHPTGQP